MGTISLDAAIEAHEQAAADLNRAIADALAADRISDKLAVSTTLTALRYVEKHGLTEAGRRQLRTAIEACRSVLGIEE